VFGHFGISDLRGGYGWIRIMGLRNGERHLKSAKTGRGQ